MSNGTQTFGCGPGKPVAERDDERTPDHELLRQAARGLQTAADALMTLAGRHAFEDVARRGIECEVCGRRVNYLISYYGGPGRCQACDRMTS